MDAFFDLEADKLEDAGEVDVVFDVIGSEILDRSTALVRAGGTLVTIARSPTVQPKDGRAIFFVVEPDRSRLVDLARRIRDGRIKPRRGNTAACRRALSFRPRPAHPRQDDHPDQGGRIGRHNGPGRIDRLAWATVITAPVPVFGGQRQRPLRDSSGDGYRPLGNVLSRSIVWRRHG